MRVRYDRNDEITRRFEELDKDRNGVLSPQEVVHVIQEMMGVDQQTAVAMMRMFDTNRDGSLDKTEFMQLWANMFGQWSVFSLLYYYYYILHLFSSAAWLFGRTMEILCFARHCHVQLDWCIAVSRDVT